jgi:hypothetical protein
LRALHQMAASPGTYSVTGANVGLVRHLVLPALKGSYAVLGAQAYARIVRTLVADPGTYLISGRPAELVYESLLQMLYLTREEWAVALALAEGFAAVAWREVGPVEEWVTPRFINEQWLAEAP